MRYKMHTNSMTTGAVTGGMRTWEPGQEIEAPEGEFAHLPDDAYEVLVQDAEPDDTGMSEVLVQDDEPDDTDPSVPTVPVSVPVDVPTVPENKPKRARK